MNKEIKDKIQVLVERAKTGKPNNPDPRKKSSNIPNSLADHIKTKEQAHSFMTLLRSL